jgi:hypothetical protein
MKQVYGNPTPQVISKFYIKPSKATDGTQTGDLMCDDLNGNKQPIAHNVVNMKVSYLSSSSTGNVTHYKAADDVPMTPTNSWNTAINGLEVCLTFLGEPIQTPKYQPSDKDCLGNSFPNNGRIYRTFRQNFYLRNNA